MLGNILFRRAMMAPTDADRDKAAAEAVESSIKDNGASALIKLYADVKNGSAQPGSLTAIIDIILLELFSDYTLSKSSYGKPGTIDIQSVSKILKAA
ncbi:MAG: hypothetical protein ACYC5N_11525 [Endomicrobiales bacterium]